MHIGHVHLATFHSGAGNNFVELIESLQQYDVQQHVLLSDATLARRVAHVEQITVGPTVRSAIVAYCMMPTVDLVHVHEPLAARAGLLLTLTRGLPFVLTHHDAGRQNNRIDRAVYKRAAAIIDDRDSDGARYLRIYRHAIESWRTSSVLR